MYRSCLKEELIYFEYCVDFTFLFSDPMLEVKISKLSNNAKYDCPGCTALIVNDRWLDFGIFQEWGVSGAWGRSPDYDIMFYGTLSCA